MRKLPPLVGASPVVAVYVSDFKPPDLDMVLAYFDLFGKVAWIRPEASPALSDWITRQNTRLGREGAGFAPGYYLFKDGEACRYESGLIDFELDRLSLGVGAVAGVIALMALDIRLAETARAIARAQAAARVLGAFLAAVGGSSTASANANTPPPPPAAQPSDEVSTAFRVLGIDATATHAEVKARYRALAKEWHPDRFAGDARRVAEAEARMSQINVACYRHSETDPPRQTETDPPPG
jgi:hypothetical protein